MWDIVLTYCRHILILVISIPVRNLVYSINTECSSFPIIHSSLPSLSPSLSQLLSNVLLCGGALRLCIIMLSWLYASKTTCAYICNWTTDQQNVLFYVLCMLFSHHKHNLRDKNSVPKTVEPQYNDVVGSSRKVRYIGSRGRLRMLHWGYNINSSNFKFCYTGVLYIEV